MRIHKGTPLSDGFDVVDAFTAKSGPVATILVRQGDDFLRTATSLKKDDGNRSSGTPPGADHPARPALLAGNTYTGKATMFGRDFITHCIPVRDAAGLVVAVFFVGLELTEGLKALKQGILAIKVGETGYVAALDAGPQKCVAIIHPAKEGANLLAAKDSRGVEFVREMRDRKSGVIRYDWANPRENSPRRRCRCSTTMRSGTGWSCPPVVSKRSAAAPMRPSATSPSWRWRSSSQPWPVASPPLAPE